MAEVAGSAMKTTQRKESKPEVSASAAQAATPLTPAQLFFNRELSWLEFNRRVLEEALDDRQPLLERLKFLAIFATNLDEFFMIRVSGLKEEVEEEVTERSPDGLLPAEQLQQISERLRPLVLAQMRCLREEILPALKEQGITLTPYRELTPDERRALDTYFIENVFPILTPQAVDRSHPFPYISNLSLNLGLMLEPEQDGSAGAAVAMRSGSSFARVKVPPSVPRLVPVDASGARFTFLGELITANIAELFPGMRTSKSYVFRVTRDADIEIREDEASDLIGIMERNLRRRRFGAAVRLEVAAKMPAAMVKYLTESLKLTTDDVYAVDGPMNLPDLMTLYDVPQPALKDAPLQPVVPALLKQSATIFDAIKAQDVLVHHPYTSYSTVTDFIEAAAKDEQVLAIKMCLYRTGRHSPIVQALMKASERGKQVAALVELKARFDEENNIGWARRLEREGVHVVYGVQGLKTHCKVALVVRREENKLRRYVHLATGNYNPTTSRIYTDFGLFTANEEIGGDVSDLFNYLTGYSRQANYQRLLVAPVNLRARMMELIKREVEHKEAGRPARIIAKINSLTDTEIIQALYEASRAGVAIDLLVRGVCMLRPGVAGLSDTIKVSSVVGRFLEHSRVYYFANGGAEDIYIGSADWMRRNLDRRVEVLVPIAAPQLKRYLKDEVLDAYLRDNMRARQLKPDGSYERLTPAAGEQSFDVQTHFIGRNA